MARPSGAAAGMRNRELMKLITDIHLESRGTYGWPRVHAELVLGLGEKVNRKRVARLMRQAGLQGHLPAQGAQEPGQHRDRGGPGAPPVPRRCARPAVADRHH